MPVKGPYSQIIQPNKFVAPLDLNVYMKGVMYKEELAKNNLHDISTIYSGLSSIPAEGPDARVLNSKIENLRNNLKNLNISNLGDINTSSSIRQMIGEVSNDPDVLNITRRSVAVQSERAKQKAAQEKGGDYTSPILKQAEKYYSGDDYIRDLSFNKEGWNTPQMAKLKNEYLKDVPKIKKQVKVGNYWHTIESYDPEAYRLRLEEMYNLPSVKKQMDYDFDIEYENYDFATEGVKSAQATVDKAKLQSDQAYRILQTSKQGSPEYNNALVKYQDAQEFINKYTPLISNPGLLGENLKARMKNDKIKQLIELDIAGEQFYSDAEAKADQFDLNNQQFSHSIALKQQEFTLGLQKKQADDISLGASIKGWSLEETLKNPAKIQEAALAGQQAKLAEFESKEGIKLENKIKAQQQKANSLMNIKPGDIVHYYDSGTSSEIGVTWSKIAESTKDQKSAKANKRFILDLINTLRVKNGQDILPDIDKLEIATNGELKYDKSLIPFYGNETIQNLAKLADPRTYMNVDVSFADTSKPIFSVSEYNTNNNTTFTVDDFKADSNYVNNYTIVP